MPVECASLECPGSLVNRPVIAEASSGFELQLRRVFDTHPITTKNPQANSVCERSHQAIGNALRVLSTLEPPPGTDAATPTLEAAERIIETAISDTIFALRSTLNSATNTTPGGLAFHRDMIMDLPLIADLQQIQKRRQQLIDDRLIVANRKRFSHDYLINDQVLKLTYKPDKLQPRAEGPYRIVSVHTNGTVTIRKSPYVIERINIRSWIDTAGVVNFDLFEKMPITAAGFFEQSNCSNHTMNSCIMHVVI